MLIEYKIMAGLNVKCVIDDDCHTEMDVCEREQMCKQAKLPSDGVCAKGSCSVLISDNFHQD